MTPIIAQLLANGLSLLGNAVLAKGKDVVENKLGIKLPEDTATLTSEQIVVLKKAQMEHEHFLLSLGLKHKEQELQQFTLEVEDTKNARARDSEIIRNGGRNWRGDIMAITAFLGVFLAVYLVWATPTLSEYAKGVMTFILGRFTGYVDTIFNFEFGSTRSNKSKDVTIENLSGKSK